MTSGDRASWHAFTAVSASIFAVGAALTAFWCASMQPPAMMSMPGGWTMSMAWMRMPGQTWPGAAASFLGMWTSMMVAMMLPALAPPLWAYQQAIAGSVGTGIGGRTTFAGTGYFVVWIAFGMAVYPVGAGFAAIEMRQPSLAKAVPAATGVAVIVAGLLQFTAWKMRQLACCREMSERGRSWAPDVFAAWRYGIRLGLHCIGCCLNLMTILVAVGIMDLRVMAAVTAAITVERVAPAPGRIARAVGVVVVGAGVLLIARAAGAG